MGGDSGFAKSRKGFGSLIAGTIRPVRAVVAGLALAAAPLVAGGLASGQASALTPPSSSVTATGEFILRSR